MKTIRRAASIALAAALLASASSARAADDDEGLKGPRIAVVPAIGAGVGVFTGQRSPFPSFVGLTLLQAEASYEIDRWGAFARFGFASSGQDGRWTAPIIATGASYRLEGDGDERWGLVARGGFVYQRWHADAGGCDVAFFIPSNCKDFIPPTLPGQVGVTPLPAVTTVDTLGLLAGLRAEAPLRDFFLAFGVETSGTVDVSQSQPGLVWTAQLTLALGLRNHQAGNEPMRGRRNQPLRYRTRTDQDY